MTHALTRISLLVSTVFALAIFVVGRVLAFVGLASLPEDASSMLDLMRTFAVWAVDIPWYVILPIFFALLAATVYVFRLTYAREVVVKSDTEIVTIRAGKNVELDLNAGSNFLLRPAETTKIKLPKNPREGMFRLYVLHGETVFDVGFDEAYQFVSPQEPSVKRESGRLYEYQIIVVLAGADWTYWVNDTMAYLAVAEQVRSEATKGIKQAHSHAFFLSQM